MKNKQLNKEEQILSNKLNELNFEYNSADWEILQDRLPANGTASWLSGKAMIGIAAMAVILIGGIYYFTSNQTEETAINDSIQEKVVLPTQENLPTETQSEEKINPPNANSNKLATNAVDSETSLEENNSKKLEENKVNKATTPEKVEKEEIKIPDTKKENIQVNEEVEPTTEYEFKALTLPTSICPNSLFKVEIAANNPLPKGWSIDWLMDGNLISRGTQITGLELKENGSKEVAVNIRNEKNEIVEMASRSITTVNIANYTLNFTYTDSEDPYTDLQVQLKSEDDGLTNHRWIGEGGSQLGSGNLLSYAFTDKGVYDITLIAKTKDGCELEHSKPVSVEINFDPLAPNAFTPNQDGSNDTFMPEAFKTRNDRFRMEIFNLQGELIFRSNSQLEGWNGQLNNNGQLMPEGIYVWKVVISNEKAQEKAFAGNLRLMINP